MLRYYKIRDVKSPIRSTALSAGIDFFIPNDFPDTFIGGGHDLLIPSGIVMEIPDHCCLIGVDKSGIASSSIAKMKAGLTPKNNQESPLIVGAKLIDADYSGEIHLHLINPGHKAVLIRGGMKIAQFILLPVLYDNCVEVKTRDALYFPSTERDGGFSSTGI